MESAPFCIDAKKPFRPEKLLEGWEDAEQMPKVDGEEGSRFADRIKKVFSLDEQAEWPYQAMGFPIRLGQVQVAIGAKRANRLHDWYIDEEGEVIDYPPLDDCAAYAQIFSPAVALPKALNAFKSQAKSGSLRAQISERLLSRYHNTLPGVIASKAKPDRKHANPYYSFWSYACKELEWAGPWANTERVETSHYILPIFYHHFGCVVPTYAALVAIAKLAQPAKPSKEPVRPILDIGSGCGYWTFMLRSLPLEPGMLPLDVRAIDNQTSIYRTAWVGDTILQSGTTYLASHKNGEGCILLLVYPQTTGDFTEPLLRQFKGDTIVVAGTQNANGFTAFAHQVVDQWVEKNLKEWELGLRIPLPSFPGKDEALFVFSRKTQG